jgi:hypothetical protein
MWCFIIALLPLRITHTAHTAYMKRSHVQRTQHTQQVKVSTSNKTLFKPLSLGLPDGNFRMPGRHPARIESRGILSFLYFR